MTHQDIFDRLGWIDAEPLSAVQLNQLLVLGHEAPAGDGFFHYYWLRVPERHSYNVREIAGFSEEWVKSEAIQSPLRTFPS